jgi:hypothetical protein
VPSATLLQLLAVPIEDDVRQQLLSDLNVADFPITDWQTGGVMKTFVELITRAVFTYAAKLIPTITAGGFLTEADETWLRTMLAPQLYNLTPSPATFTIEQGVLTCDAANGPYTITVGQLLAITTAGRRYSNITGGSLATSGTLTLQWQSEGPNDSTVDATNYIDGANSMTSLVTPLSGVTINNPAIDYTPTTLNGVGPNVTIVPSRTNPVVPPSAGAILITITASGQVGAATFSYRRIGFAGITDPPLGVSGGFTSSSFQVPLTGTTLSFVNAPLIATTFAKDSLYAISSPGGPIITQGRDIESVAALIARCQARWPDLSAIPTPSKFKLWAFAADPQVTKVGVSTGVATLTTPLLTQITIGGQLNPLSGSVVVNVQLYIDRRLGLAESAIVSTASPCLVPITGYVTSPVGTSAAVQVAADAAWSSYIAGLDIGATAKLSELQRIIGDAVKSVAGPGAQYDTRALAITGANAYVAPDVTTPVNLSASASQVLTIPPNGLPSQALVWYEA